VNLTSNNRLAKSAFSARNGELVLPFLIFYFLLLIFFFNDYLINEFFAKNEGFLNALKFQG